MTIFFEKIPFNFGCKKKFNLAAIFFLFCFFSCVTPPKEQIVSREICGTAVKSAASLRNFFLDKNPQFDKKTIFQIAKFYVKESAAEGINSDVAFVQMCLETNYLRFGNLVSAEMNNFCGLGAIDEENRGEIFATKRDGIRAHIQHLHAYGTKENATLKNPLIDNRYKFVVPRGKAPSVFELAGSWAADRDYGKKLDALLSQLEKY